MKFVFLLPFLFSHISSGLLVKQKLKVILPFCCSFNCSHHSFDWSLFILNLFFIVFFYNFISYQLAIFDFISNINYSYFFYYYFFNILFLIEFFFQFNPPSFYFILFLSQISSLYFYFYFFFGFFL
jgi:hypothetical protein